MKSIRPSTELYHHGIPGMHWHVRRYQNADGSLTEEGKRRLKDRTDKKESKKEQKDAKKAQKPPKPESSTWKSKEAKYLSDEELNRRNSRLQREQQYRMMTETRGKKIWKGVGKAASKILIGSLVGVAAGAMSKNYKGILEAGEKFLNGGEWMDINLANLQM